MARPNQRKRKVRILVVDDHPVVRQGLAAQVKTQPDLEICGEAEDVAGALPLVGSARPDVAIIDISLKSGNGIDLIKRIKARHPSVRLLVWSMYPEDLYAERALRAGALGYVNKGRATAEILDAIRCVRAGNFYLSPDLSSRLLGRLVGASAQQAERSPVERLSDRELEVFELIGQGLSTEQIADKMHLSPKTVETYRSRVKAKFDVDHSTELVQLAVQWMLERK